MSLNTKAYGSWSIIDKFITCRVCRVMCGKPSNYEIAVPAAERRHHNKPVRTCSQAPVIPAKAGIQSTESGPGRVRLIPCTGFVAYHSNRLAKPRIQRDREDPHSTNALPGPRHSGEGRNPEGRVRPRSYLKKAGALFPPAHPRVLAPGSHTPDPLPEGDSLLWTPPSTF